MQIKNRAPVIACQDDKSFVHNELKMSLLMDSMCEAQPNTTSLKKGRECFHKSINLLTISKNCQSIYGSPASPSAWSQIGPLLSDVRRSSLFDPPSEGCLPPRQAPHYWTASHKGTISLLPIQINILKTAMKILHKAVLNRVPGSKWFFDSAHPTTHGLNLFRSRRQNCSRGVNGRPSTGRGGSVARDLKGGNFFTPGMQVAL